MAQIDIKRIGRAKAEIAVVGTAPLIANRFSAKAKQMMLDAQQGRKVQRGHKDPEKCFQEARYKIDADRDGLPATAFKAAIVDAARHFDKVTMTELKQMIFVKGEEVDGEMLVQIEGPVSMREDAVRNATGVADLRYRPMYWPWKAVLSIIYVYNSVTFESLLALVDAAGIGGVGEWRPASKKSKTGMYGTFRLDETAEMKEIKL